MENIQGILGIVIVLFIAYLFFRKSSIFKGIAGSIVAIVIYFFIGEYFFSLIRSIEVLTAPVYFGALISFGVLSAYIFIAIMMKLFNTSSELIIRIYLFVFLWILVSTISRRMAGAPVVPSAFDISAIWMFLTMIVLKVYTSFSNRK